MAKMRCPHCAHGAGRSHVFCVECGRALPGRGGVTKSAGGSARRRIGPAPGIPWGEHLYSPDPGLRQLAATQINKAAGARPPAAVPWRELIHDPDPALRILALDQVSKGIGA